MANNRPPRFQKHIHLAIINYNDIKSQWKGFRIARNTNARVSNLHMTIGHFFFIDLCYSTIL